MPRAIEISVDVDGSNAGPTPPDFECLEEVSHCQSESEGFSLTATQAHLAVPALLQLLNERGWRLNRLTTRQANLEDVFVTLTGRHLRDE